MIKIYDSISKTPKVEFIKLDTVSTIFKIESNNILVHNFASYLEPGGGYLRGAKAQEEDLCRSSNLYNILSKEKDYYEFNNNHINNELYLNRALISDNIIFKKDNKEKQVKVLTCAAPMAMYARKIGINENDINKSFKERIQFISYIVNEEKPDVFLTGAFGCGVFDNDIYKCAKYYKESFKITNAHKIIFAVPDNKLEVFKEVYND